MQPIRTTNNSQVLAATQSRSRSPESGRSRQDDRHTGLPSNNRGFQRGNPGSDERRGDSRRSIDHQFFREVDGRQGEATRSQFSGRYSDDRPRRYPDNESRRDQRGDAGSGYARGQSDRQAENSTRAHVGSTNGGSTDTRQPGKDLGNIHSLVKDLSGLVKKKDASYSEFIEKIQVLIDELTRLTVRSTGTRYQMKNMTMANCLYALQLFPTNPSPEEKNLINEILCLITSQLTSATYPFNNIDISMALSGLRNMSSETQQVKDLLKVLRRKIEVSTGKLTGQNIGSALYGLKNMSSKDQEVEDLLKVLATKISDSEAILKAQEIAMSLYGLQNMSSDCEGVRAVLVALTYKISHPDVVLDAQAIGSALYALKNMSSKDKAVIDLLKVLTKKIFKSKAVLNAQAIGNALYGLKNMSSKDKAVKDLLKVLTKKIKDSTEELDGQAIGNALYGLQNMSSEHDEVKDLLKVLRRKIRASTKKLTAQNIGTALYGLKNMSSKDKAVKGLLKVLRRKIEASTEELDGQAIGNALYGLQNMSSEHDEVKDLLKVLRRKIEASTEKLTAQNIGTALYGLKNMSSKDKAVKGLLKVLTTKIKASTEELDGQAIVNALYGLRKMSFDDIKPIVDWLCMQIPKMAINQAACFEMIQFLSAHRDHIAEFRPIVDQINKFCKKDDPSIRFLNATLLTDHCKNELTFESDLAKIHPLLKKGMDAESGPQYPIGPNAKNHLVKLFSTETLCQYIQKFDLANDDGSAADPIRNNLKSFGITQDDLLVGVIQKMDIGNLDDVIAVQETLENLHAHDRLPKNSIADRVFSLRMKELAMRSDRHEGGGLWV